MTLHHSTTDTPSAYTEFLQQKTHLADAGGFAPHWIPDFLFPFQRALCEWAIQKGRAALFCDCGMGKSPIALVWAENVIRETRKPVLILTPLAVGAQFEREGEKFGIECQQSRDGQRKRNITITNYEQLHKFRAADFAGVVCDESSILKHFTGATQRAVTTFLAQVPYRLLCTATAAPNDYTELGTSSEALGVLGTVDMLSRFFRIDNTSRHKFNMRNGNQPTTQGHVAGTGGAWRLKFHAAVPFWRWVCSWARACRKPSDLGFDDTAFVLPPLHEQEHVVEAATPQEGMLFSLPVNGFHDERAERKRTLDARCDYVARLVEHNKQALVWCHYNSEGDLLTQLIPDAIQVAGGDSDSHKEDAYRAFQAGEVRVLITKPKIGAWGLNLQNCAHVVTFAHYSYEQYYQSIRRCWRFGQTQPVHVDIITTPGEQHVREAMVAKARAADAMFAALVTHMQDAQQLVIPHNTQQTEVPSWL